MIRFRAGGLAAVVLCLAGAAVHAEPVSVVASFSILGDVVERVGAQHVNVSSLVGPDQDAHVFQPRPSDVAAVGKAQLVVINGLGFEGWIARLIQAAGYRGPVALATDGVAARGMAAGAHAHGDADDHGHDHGHGRDAAAGRAGGAPDPHAWQNPLNVARYAHNVAGALSVLEPERAADFQANARAYEDELKALDAWIAQRIAAVPEARRVVITTHDAMGYYADRYHVKFIPAQGINTASEPSARQVANLVRQVRAEGVSALFVENMASDTVLRQIAAETGVSVGGRLYSDALSAPTGEAPDYITMMRRNTERLVAAMQGGKP